MKNNTLKLHSSLKGYKRNINNVNTSYGQTHKLLFCHHYFRNCLLNIAGIINDTSNRDDCSKLHKHSLNSFSIIYISINLNSATLFDGYV